MEKIKTKLRRLSVELSEKENAALNNLMKHYRAEAAACRAGLRLLALYFETKDEGDTLAVVDLKTGKIKQIIEVL